ncbi:putative ATP-dependent zinc protease [Photobacterium sp. Hal280]|uniref:putative ATP-dependent zinc protease n=1 Tax=Photobacterium sp. Hal280 TaxID=3035163 RepID=UPI00301C3145
MAYLKGLAGCFERCRQIVYNVRVFSTFSGIRMKKTLILFVISLMSGCVSSPSTPPSTQNEDVAQADKAITSLPEDQSESVKVMPSVPVVVTPTETTPQTVQTPPPVAKPQPEKVKTRDGKLILGQHEWVWLSPAKQFVKVRINQEQKASTLGVTALVPFERDGNEWVKFTARGMDFELPVTRWLEKEDAKSAIVQVRTILGDLNALTDFALVEGKDVVLGENFTKDVAIVDSTRDFVQPKKKK